MQPQQSPKRKHVILVVPYIGVQIKIVTRQLKTCINRFYGCINLRVILLSADCIKFLFPSINNLVFLVVTAAHTL